MERETEISVKSFESALAWGEWLQENVGLAQGIWMRIAKKASPIITVTYDEALDVALCFGWIDGKKTSHDDDYFLQKWTPRRARSLWSKRNIAKVTRLLEAGKMRPTVLREVETATQDGRWDAAYDSPKEMSVPEDFRMAVQKSETAQAFFATLNKSQLYNIGWRLQTAKTPETRARRFAKLLQTLENGVKPRVAPSE